MKKKQIFLIIILLFVIVYLLLILNKKETNGIPRIDIKLNNSLTLIELRTKAVNNQLNNKKDKVKANFDLFTIGSDRFIKIK